MSPRKSPRLRKGAVSLRARRPGYRSRENFGAALREIWLSPRRFFRDLDPHGGPIRPTLFAAAVLFLNLLLDALLLAVYTQEIPYALLYAPLLGLVFSLVLTPILLAGLTALILVILDGSPSRRRFGPVYRALGYASAIAFPLWIPYAGLIAVPYGLYVATVAVKESLNLPWRQAAAAAIIPIAALLLILLLLLGPIEAYDILLNPPGG